MYVAHLNDLMKPELIILVDMIKILIFFWKGEPGQQSNKSFATADQAIKDFEKKFKDKTRNVWASRADFKPVPGKYTLLEMDEEEGGEEETADKVRIF